jgi:hypothetical protein
MFAVWGGSFQITDAHDTHCPATQNPPGCFLPVAGYSGGCFLGGKVGKIHGRATSFKCMSLGDTVAIAHKRRMEGKLQSGKASTRETTHGI